MWSECGWCGKRFGVPDTYNYWTHLCWRMLLEPRCFWARLQTAFYCWRHPDLCEQADREFWD